jgi:hypothetical protein
LSAVLIFLSLFIVLVIERAVGLVRALR